MRVADDLYMAPWHRLPLKVQKCFTILLAINQQPHFFSGSNLVTANRDSFTEVIFWHWLHLRRTQMIQQLVFFRLARKFFLWSCHSGRSLINESWNVLQQIYVQVPWLWPVFDLRNSRIIQSWKFRVSHIWCIEWKPIKISWSRAIVKQIKLVSM